jgi:YfiR/HmsC-like
MKLFIARAIALVASLAAMPSLAGGHVPGDIEANFLINLFRFVSWPHSPPDTATICFLRPSDVHARLEGGVSHNETWTQVIPGRRIIVKMLSDAETQALTEPDDNVGCQILYLDARTADQLWPALSASLKPASLLTVSTQKDFAYRGGMIQIRWEATDTYRIVINPVNITRADVTISVALATLADRVDDARFHTR